LTVQTDAERDQFAQQGFTDPVQSSPSDDRATTRLPQLESTRLYRRIAELLETRIDQGLFPAGTFLPPERELCRTTGGKPDVGTRGPYCP